MSTDATPGSGGRLDDDHAPETNGRMAVCRRCGARTDAAGAHHVPADGQLARIDDWLEGQRTQRFLADRRAARGG
jgi:hypothetical protein